MRRVLAVVLVLVAPGCGPDANRVRAGRTVELAREALARVERTSGGESDLVRARDDAERWLEHTEQALESWGGGRSLAYETMVPCLGRALGRLREQMVRDAQPVPESLRDAEALARTASERRCVERRARTEERAR